MNESLELEHGIKGKIQAIDAGTLCTCNNIRVSAEPRIPCVVWSSINSPAEQTTAVSQAPTRESLIL
jgi:hypothetical protein